jgi:hypothetical protein
MLQMNLIRALVVLGLMAVAGPASAQFNIAWNATTGAYSTGANWLGGSPPVADFDDVGVINNGGTAQVADAPVSPGGIILGQAAGNSGTLEIRSGGHLSVVNGAGGAASGAVVVGQSGLGSLNVLRGGTLTANSLSSGGDAASAVVLGQLAGTGVATLQINGAANLQRNTRLVGPNVAFNTTSLAFGAAHTLTAEITGTTHSAIKVSGAATLDGAINIAFNGYSPVIGNSWTLVDASTLSGQFRSVGAATPLPAGLGLGVTTESGGVNGNIARVSVMVQPTLEINRRTGVATIRNQASQGLDIDGYLITSAGGALNPAGWTSFQDGGQSGWTESNPTAKHLGELSINGSRTLAAGSAIGLGTAYTFAPTELGQTQEDVTFEYHAAGGQTFAGKVQFIGPENNVVLLVDPATGQAAIQNQSIFHVDLDGYLITSSSNSLSPTSWTSFQDSGQSGWTESNPTPKHLGELNLTGSRSLGPSGSPLPIGSPFTAGATPDLTFQYRLTTGETMAGLVRYGALSTGDSADFDGDSDVDGNDFLIWQRRLGSAGGPGDANGDGAVNALDLAIWKQQAGAPAAVSASAVPEPGALALTLVGVTALKRRRTVRRFASRASRTASGIGLL